MNLTNRLRTYHKLIIVGLIMALPLFGLVSCWTHFIAGMAISILVFLFGVSVSWILLSHALIRVNRTSYVCRLLEELYLIVGALPNGVTPVDFEGWSMFRFSKYCRKIQAANSTYWNVLPDMISPNRSQLGERLEYVSEGTRNQFFRLPIWEGSNWDVKQVWARPMILDSRDGSWEKCELRKQVKDLLAHWRI